MITRDQAADMVALTPERIRAAQERRRSGAAGPHADRRTRRRRDRGAQRRAAVAEGRA